MALFQTRLHLLVSFEFSGKNVRRLSCFPLLGFQDLQLLKGWHFPMWDTWGVYFGYFWGERVCFFYLFVLGGWIFFLFLYSIPRKNLPRIWKQSSIFGILVQLFVVLEFRKFLEMENNVAITVFKKKKKWSGAFGLQMTLISWPFWLSWSKALSGSFHC